MSKNKNDNPILTNSLSSLIDIFSKNDVISEIEKQYSVLPIKNIPVGLVDDNRYIKRAHIKDNRLNDLADKIRANGIYNPLIVREVASHYELVLGRRRFLAGKLAGLKEFPCVIAKLSDEETLLMLLADGRDQRESDVVEMAMVYKALSSEYGYTQETLGRLSHQSRCQITNSMRILRLPDPILKDISSGKISYGHARAILSLSEAEMMGIEKKILKEKLSVRETETLVKEFMPNQSGQDDNLVYLANRLKAKKLVKKGNSITISFSSKKDLDAFVATFQTSKL